jgi:FPC/CPF motif-containing protein YcgG
MGFAQALTGWGTRRDARGPLYPVAGERQLRAFRAFVQADSFPCVGSRLSMAGDGVEVVGLRALGRPENDAVLLDGLEAFGRRVDAAGDDTREVLSFAAVFNGPSGMDELQFEVAMWDQLQRLHDLDTARGNAWADDVCDVGDDPRFSMSLAGHPFFVVGLHPGASRMARRFQSPALVFNSHRQFNRLKADGRFAKMQAATRARDVALQGDINPNLAAYGDASEARQYSGRAVGEGWRCPLHVHRRDAA